MPFLLSSQNVWNYLIEQKLCKQEEQNQLKSEQRSSKNFNLLVTLADGRRLLVKQESLVQEEASDYFLNEGRIHSLLKNFSELSLIRPLVSEAIHFDPKNSIIIFNFLDNYEDLNDFYKEQHTFPTVIAVAVGAAIATIHSATIDCQQYKKFFVSDGEESLSELIPNFLHGLERVRPEVFGAVTSHGIEFLKLYQLYDSLGKAIAELNTAFQPCCLTHKDLKLDNILLHKEWQHTHSSMAGSEPDNTIIRLIDWEHSDWGDPAFDLGIVIASYLKIWLTSMVVSTDIDIETSLRLAVTPLELIQPSIVAMTRAYLERFPEILERRPDFLRRVMQFTGLALIFRIRAALQYKEPFDNRGICMLQIAKTLLCRPETSAPAVFGVEESELTKNIYSPV